MIWRNVTLAIFLFISGQVLAQGTWEPAGADLSYPRTLLKAAHIPAVQAALTLAGNLELYTGIFNSVTGTPPGAPSTDHNLRRTHATFAKNLAFVVLMNRKPAAPGLTHLTEVERALYTGHVRSMLGNINTTVENVISYTNWQWTSKELIDYMIAYDLLRGAGETDASLAPAKARLQEFAGNLYAQSQVSFFGYSFFRAIKNNHALMTAAALGLSAVVLNDAGSTKATQQPLNWINAGMFHQDNVLWRDASRQSDPDAIAGYAEGPYYFKYAFLNCLPFIRSMGHFLPDNSLNYTAGGTTRSIRNPYYDPSYDRLYQWMSAILMPDGRYPALEDAFIDMGMPELALTGKSQYVQPMYFQNFAPGQMASLQAQLRDATVDMRAAYLAANIIPAPASHPALTVLPLSGNLVFRSGTGPQASYLHLYGKNGLAQSVTGGHNQGDASSFILHAKGQLLALDPGYLSAGKRDSLGKATNHNLILVDGAGPVIGADGTTNDAEAFIQKPFTQGDLAYGEVRTHYQNTTITRKTLSVRNTYYLIADFIESNAAHNFTWQLHGYGLEGGTATTGTFSDNLAEQEATWHKNGVNLKAHVTATGQASAYATGINYHERIWNQSEKHTTLLVHKNGVAQTQFLSLLMPYTDQAPTVTTASTANTAALSVKDAGYQDLAFLQGDTVLTTLEGMPQPAASDALTTFVSLNPDNTVHQAFLEQGRNLQYGPTTLIRSSRRANISWQQVSPLGYSVYVSQPTTVSLPVERRPSSVLGASNYTYDASTQTLSLTVNEQTGPVTLSYTLPDTTLSDSTLTDTTLVDSTLTDSTLTDTTLTDSTLTDITVPDTTVPDSTLTDTTLPDTTLTDTTLPDSTLTDTSLPDTMLPDTSLTDTTLPVELVQFDGQREQSQVLLSWQTPQEHHNAGFAIQRRTDQDPEFQQIAFVKGARNKLSLSQYHYRDSLAPATTVYYRLQQINLDGTITNSPVIAVPGKASASPTLTVAPVPANQYVDISFSDPARQIMLQVVSLQGQVLQRIIFQQQVRLDVSHLAAGLYMLQALDASGQLVAPNRKIIIGH
jgi:uncharacterized protein YjbI with pentapeptide repeats